jgi:aspartate aminotransferase-like enzyme
MTLVQTTTTTHEQPLHIPVPEVEPRTAIPLQNLLFPGPTPVPPAVLAELARPLINHRGPEFAAILHRVTARLQYVFQTTSPVLTFPASGTGGQECAIVNLFSPGENDLKTLVALIRRQNLDALLVVDAVSSLGCMPFEMDAWDIDVVFTASQKGLMCPPGLMMLAIGPRAWRANAQASLPRSYFDWAATRKALEHGQHPVTPPVSLFYALDLALEMMLTEGLEAIFARHQRLGEYVRRRVRAIGLQLLADSAHVSNTVTAVRVPNGIDAKVLLTILRERDQLVLAGGQEHLSGKIVRIGHMGCCQVRDLFTALNCLQVRLQELGFHKVAQKEEESQW